MKIKSIISTGQGRLHLMDSAIAIKKAGVEVKVITGWVPSERISDKFINFLGSLVGRNNLVYGLQKRRSINIESKELFSCAFSEFLIQFLFILSKFKLLKRESAAVIGWKVFGWQSKKYIKKADIFHVRSGAGHGKAIEKAREGGMIILADHSAAHPKEIHKQLSKAYNESNIPFNPNSGFWKMVLDDCNKADFVLVNSNYVKKTFINNGFKSNLLYVIPLGIRNDFFNLKSNYKKNKTLKLLFTGSINKWKGVHLIIEAAKVLNSKNILIEIDFIGSVSNEIQIPIFLNNHTLLKFHGHLPQDQLKSYLTNADIYIFPSYCEGSAQSLKEAMAAGLPVIATEQSGAPIIHGENGWIIPDNSSDDIVNAIILLSNDEALCERLGQNANKTIRTEHTWEKYGENVANLYTSLLLEKNKNSNAKK